MAKESTSQSGMKLAFNEIPNFRHGMNVLDITVPEALKRRINTGIDWVNEAFGGKGLTPSTAGLLTGTPGAGKTTFLLQLADSLTGSGHVCLFNTGEESLLQVRTTVERLGVRNGFVPGNDRMAADVLNHADMLARSNPGKQVVLICDSLQTLDDGFYPNGATNSMTPIRVFEMFTEWAKATFGIVLVIGQVTKDGKFAGKQQLIHMIDVHGHLMIDEKPKSETYGMRIFKMKKNRFGCSGKGFVLNLDSKGLTEAGSYTGEGEDE